MLIVITIILVLFAVLAIRKFIWALGVLVASLPLYVIRFNMFNLPSTLLEGLILVLFIVWLIKFRPWENLNKLWRELPYKWPLFLFLVACVTSLIISPQLREATGIFKAYILETLFIYLVVSYLIFVKGKKDETLKAIFTGLGVGILYLSVYAVFQKFTGIGIAESWVSEEGRRVASILGYPNSLALYLSPLIAIYLVLALRKEIIKTWLAWSTFVLGMVALIFTVSEGGMIATTVSILVAVFFMGYKKIFVTLIILLIAIAIIIPIFRNQAIEILSGTDVSTDVRLQLWKGTWRMIKAHPVLGVGLRGFEANYEEFKEPAHTEIMLYPHNILFNFWTETGILGVVAVTWLLILILRYNIKTFFVSRDVTALVSIVFFTAIIIHGLVDAPFFKNDLSVMFMMMVAVAGCGKVLAPRSVCSSGNGSVANERGSKSSV